MTCSVRLIAITQGAGDLINKTAQDIISYTARVSNPDNQEKFDTAPKLLAYCIRNKHWSIFQQSFLTLEIVTSRAIAAQILRHSSMHFEEWSLRYSSSMGYQIYPARRQDVKNRQNSTDDLPQETKDWFINAQERLNSFADELYSEAITKGVARESARFLLPLSTRTKLYMSGSVRSFIHWIQLRTDKSTQLEHREVAEKAKEIFSKELPDISAALGW